MTRTPHSARDESQEAPDVTVRLTSFQDGEAVLHVETGGHTARILLDQASSGLESGTAPEAARRALGPLVEGLSHWLAQGGSLVDER